MIDISLSCCLLRPVSIPQRLRGLAWVFVAAFRVDFKREFLVGALRLALAISCPEIAEIPAIRDRRFGELGPRLQEELSTNLPPALSAGLLAEYVFPLRSDLDLRAPNVRLSRG
jgi:hypothetical protein